MAKRAGST